MKKARNKNKQIKEHKDPSRFRGVEYIYLIVYFVVAGNHLRYKSAHSSTILYIFDLILATSPIIYILFKSHHDHLTGLYDGKTEQNKVSFITLYELGLIIPYNMDDYFDFSREAGKKYIEDLYAHHLEEGLKEAKESFLETGLIDSLCALELFRDEIYQNWEKYDGSEISFYCYYGYSGSCCVSYLPPICKEFGAYSSFDVPSACVIFEDRYFWSAGIGIRFRNDSLREQLDHLLYDNIKIYEDDGVTPKTIYRLPIRLKIKGNLSKDEDGRFYLDNAKKV